MKTKFHIVLLLLISSEFINSQVSQQWVARYHFISDDAARDIAVDNSGNVYVTGGSNASGGYQDYATIKYNSAGVQQWVQRYNGPGNSTDYGNSIVVDDSGNVYVTGLSNRIPFPGQPNYDITTIKYNTNGSQQWLRKYNSVGGGEPGIVLDNQGNIYVGGQAGGIGYLVIKYNSSGDSLWVRSYNSGGHSAVAMAVDSFSNVYLTGPFGTSPDWGTVKWSSQGVFQWAKIFNGPGNGSDYPKDIAVSDSGNVYVTGYVWGNNQVECATIKYNTGGILQWVVVTGYNSAGLSITCDDTENVYVAAATGDFTTIKYNSSGIQQWAVNFNGPANSTDIPCCIKLDNKGNIYVTGYATISLQPNNPDYCTIKYNNSGAQQWVIYYGAGTPQAPSDFASALAVDQSGNVYVTGYSFGDYATVKYSQPVGITQISNEIPKEYKLEQNYPNPFNPATVIKFQVAGLSGVKIVVFDVLGREIETLVNEELKPGTYEAEFSGENYPSGIYFYRMQTNEYNKTLKMILIK